MTEKSCTVLPNLQPLGGVMENLDPILSEVGRFMDEKSLSGPNFGNLAVGDSQLVFDLMRGQPISDNRRRRIADYITRNEHTIYGQSMRKVVARQSPEVEAAYRPVLGSQALLKALWRDHTPILERLAAQGLQVVRP